MCMIDLSITTRDMLMKNDDVKKGESLGSAVKRYMSMNTDAAPAQDSTPSGEPRNQVGSYTSRSGIQFTVE
jgi:hypothetical protein